jgi:hypothetical protein
LAPRLKANFWSTDLLQGEFNQEEPTRMKKLMAFAALVALGAAPAYAHGPGRDSKPEPGSKAERAAGKCKPHAVGYKARGTLVSQSLTQTAGAATPKRGDDRYSGDLSVDVAKANHHGPTGVQPFTLDNARVKFYDADHNHVADTPQAGDRVTLHGKITRLARHCDQTGFTPTITVRKVDFKRPKPKPQP